MQFPLVGNPVGATNICRQLAYENFRQVTDNVLLLKSNLIMKTSYLNYFSRLTTTAASQSNYQHRDLIMIALDWTRPKDPPLSLGHASIVANLRKHTNKLSIIERSYAVNKPEFRTESVVEFILENAKTKATCDVALGAFVWNEHAIQKIISQTRQQGFSGRIILGGPQISYVKSGIENYYPQADIFIRGYAEEALAQLMSAKEDHPVIPGIHYRGTPDLGLSAKVDFDDIPSPFLSGVIKPQPLYVGKRSVVVLFAAPFANTANLIQVKNAAILKDPE